jgi:hypothetical protein
MTLDRAIEAFKAEFPGWWFKVGECRMSCDAEIGLDKHDLGPSGIHLDEDLTRYRYFDGSDEFSVDLPQPSTVADALLYVMALARTARIEFRSKSVKAHEMEVRAIKRKGKFIDADYVKDVGRELVQGGDRQALRGPSRAVEIGLKAKGKS